MISKQKGINLISAIFLLVIIAGIGIFMFNIGNVQRQTSAFSIMSSRALYAAESGVQWGIHAVLQTNDCSAFPDTFNISDGVITQFSVTVTCVPSTHTENPDTYNVFQLSARATSGSVGDPAYFSRTLRASVTDAP